MNVCYLRCYLLLERDKVKNLVEVNKLTVTVDIFMMLAEVLFGNNNFCLFIRALCLLLPTGWLYWVTA